MTPGNLRNNHLYVRDPRGFFPADSIGPSRKGGKETGNDIEIELTGLNETVRTDIGTDAKTGKPRRFLRGRSWVQRFFKHHKITEGAELTLEQLEPRRYRLSPVAIDSPTGGSLVAAEFFAGIGLVRLALERQGWNVVYANDIDPDKAEMYRHNWPKHDHLVVDDIHKLEVDTIPTCDLFTASFPCNDLSIAGKWEGLKGKESSSFWGLIRILRELGERRPRLVLLENVLGFLMSRDGQDLEEALLALNELGYAVDAFILNAVHWTPQSRVRLFIVAKQNVGGERETFAVESDARPSRLTRFIFTHQNIQWDIRKLPALPKPKKKLADIVENLPADDPNWWNKKRTEYFMSQFSERHEAEAQRMIAAI